MKTRLKVYTLLSVIFLLNMAMTCDDEYDRDYENTHSSELAKTESVNLDNAGENFVASNNPIKKEAYIIGIHFYEAEKNEDGTIKGYVKISNYNKLLNTKGIPRIYCVNDFDDNTPAGSDVTPFFRDYPLNDEYNKALALWRRMPKPGVHSFRVVIECDGGATVESETEPVTLQ